LVNLFHDQIFMIRLSATDFVMLVPFFQLGDVSGLGQAVVR
jgi:hypothetical protein